MNFCRGNCQTLRVYALAVKKEVELMSASKPWFLDSNLLFSKFSILHIFIRPGKQNAA